MKMVKKKKEEVDLLFYFFSSGNKLASVVNMLRAAMYYPRNEERDME